MLLKSNWLSEYFTSGDLSAMALASDDVLDGVSGRLVLSLDMLLFFVTAICFGGNNYWTTNSCKQMNGMHNQKIVRSIISYDYRSFIVIEIAYLYCSIILVPKQTAK